MTRRSPAKINLALSVGPVNEAGMHPIATWMVTVDLFDDLTLTMLEPECLSRYAILWHEEAKQRSEIDWSISRDLAVRAHLAIEQRVGRKLPVQLKLEKRIPVGGGLGGGSSNAATMLRAVTDLYELDLTDEDLHEIAHALGSDVPFFLHGGSAIVEGVGERIERHDRLPELDVILAFPDAACSTAEAYTAYDATDGSDLDAPAVRGLADRLLGELSIAESLFNDLAPCAIQLAPELAEHRRHLSDLAERTTYITGSGSSLFVVCDNAIHAETLAGAVEDRLDLPCIAARACDA